MPSHIWEEDLSSRDKRVLKQSGYGTEGAASWDSRSLGDNPLVLVIDLQRLFVAGDVPIEEALEEYQLAMGQRAVDTIENHIRPFLATVRQHDIPVAYTRVQSDKYDLNHPDDIEILDEVAPQPEDLVIDKRYSSSFYGTPLQSHLVKNGIDTVITIGATTSGCVRATAIDAKQHGFDVVVPYECVFDRIEISHRIALLDMWMKYADVRQTAEVEEYLENL